MPSLRQVTEAWLPCPQAIRPREGDRVGIIVLFDAETSAVMLISLVGALGLAYWECRERELGIRLTLWWLSLVLLIHVPGYLALRLWNAWAYEGAAK